MTFKPSIKDIVVKALLLNLFLLLIFFIKNQEVWRGLQISVIVTVLYFLLLIFSRRPILIKINDSVLTIRFNRFLVHNMEVTEEISDIKQSYKIEVGSKGIRRKVYRIHKGKQTILKIVPNYDGWNTAKIEALSKYLQKLGVSLID